MPFKITQLWAFVAVDEDGEEGVISMPTAMGVMPLIGADEARVRSLRPHAERIGQRGGKTVRLLRFDQMTEVEVIAPRREPSE